MWANSVWGFLGLAVALGLVVFTDPAPEYAWLRPHILVVAGLCAVASLAILFWPLLRHLWRKLRTQHNLIDLKDAAAQLYGELRGTDLGRFTEGHTGTPDEILDNVGMQILHNAPVHVRRAPSPKWEIFPTSSLSKMGVCNGATDIRYWGQDRAFYTDPKVSRRDVRRVAKHLKKNANFVSDWSKAAPSLPNDLSIELTRNPAQINAYTPVCAITIQNTSSRELDRCLVDVKEISSHWPGQMPNPLVLRTDGQIRRNGTGRFILSQGQSKTVPILFRGATRANEWFFFDENGNKYFISANPIKIVLSLYGATETKTVLIFLDVDAGWNPFPSLEIVDNDYKLPAQSEKQHP